MAMEPLKPVRETIDDKNWRVMGLRSNRDEFLVVLGTTRADCEAKLGEALSDYTREDLQEVVSIWLEEWTYDSFFERWNWDPRAELSLRRLRLRAAAIRQHALRRSA